MDFDVFLSHNSKDKPAVEEIARRLGDEYGLKCWLDKWNLIPGNPWQEEIEEALDQCQTYAVFLGPSGIGSWENEEMRAALDERVRDRKRRVIPVLLPGAPDNKTLKHPTFLKRLTWVDFRSGLDDKDALHRLSCGIKDIAPGTGSVAPRTDSTGGLPPGSYIPFPRNVIFTGREESLSILEKTLCSPPLSGEGPGVRSLITQAIIGMGGIGKTQLAVEFAYRYGDHFKGIHWLDLRDPEALESQIALCGSKMALPNWPDKQPEQVALTMQVWQTNGPRLLILDNFEEVGRANEVLACFQHPSLRLLLTSRRSDWPAALGLRRLPLEEFAPQEALDFLRRYLPESRATNEALAGLAERLGRLPLALELAGRYLEKHPRLSIPAYLAELDKALEHPSMQNWRPDLASLTAHDLSLLQTFALSWEQVKDETARQIFIMAGYCAPNTPIPAEIFEQALKIESGACDEAVSFLFGLGLLKEGPAIHPLLSEFAQRLTENQVFAKTVNAFSALATAANRTGLPKEFKEIRNHVAIVARHAEEKSNNSAGLLWNEYGYHLKQIADFSGAKAAYERAIKVLEKQPGSEHANVARVVNNLGTVLQALGDYAGAKAAYEHAIKIHEATYGPDHPDVAIDVNNLGNVLHELGDYAGAKAAFERAIKIDEATYGPDHPSVAIRVNNLGLVLQDLGDLAGAKAAFERALRIDEKAFGPDHPKVAIYVNNLGSVLHELGDYAGAKAAFERAIKIDEATYGPDHPSVARDFNNLGMVLNILGDLAGAKVAFERALRILKQFLPHDHPNIKIVQKNLDILEKEMRQKE